MVNCVSRHLLTSLIIFTALTTCVCVGNVLVVSNDGPVVNGFNLTLTANFTSNTKYYDFYFTFEDSIHPMQTVESNTSVVSYVWDCQNIECRYWHTYTVKVQLWAKRWKWQPVAFVEATNYTSYNVTRFLSGVLLAENNNKMVVTQDYISTQNMTNLSMDLYNPGDFLDAAHIWYTWTVNDFYIYVSNYRDPNISISLNVSNDYHIKCEVAAYFANSTANPHVLYEPYQGYNKGKLVMGYFHMTLHAEDPITTVKIEGNNWLKHGAVLSLSVSCDGSPPWSYCCNYTQIRNTTKDPPICDSPTMSTMSEFVCSRYYPRPGDYQVHILVGNDVTMRDSNARNLTITVYDVDHKPQLSVVIVPVICSILAFIIVMFGFSTYLNNRSRYSIEVADFNFEQSELHEEGQTFRERLSNEWREFICGIRNTVFHTRPAHYTPIPQPNTHKYNTYSYGTIT